MLLSGLRLHFGLFQNLFLCFTFSTKFCFICSQISIKFRSAIFGNVCSCRSVRNILSVIKQTSKQINCEWSRAEKPQSFDKNGIHDYTCKLTLVTVIKWIHTFACFRNLLHTGPGWGLKSARQFKIPSGHTNTHTEKIIGRGYRIAVGRSYPLPTVNWKPLQIVFFRVQQIVVLANLFWVQRMHLIPTCF